MFRKWGKQNGSTCKYKMGNVEIDIVSEEKDSVVMVQYILLTEKNINMISGETTGW